MSEFPNTEDEDNWSVFFFDCPKDKVEKLIVMLFKRTKEIIPNSLPNYTMRSWSKNSIKISFRVLRDKNNQKVVQRLERSIEELLSEEDISPIINPTGKDAEISGWSSAPLRKCKAYNRLSEFVVKLAKENLFQPDDRNEMRHLTINMLFMREAAIPPEQYSWFVDLISDVIVPQPYPFLINAAIVDLMRKAVEE
jgi:hypothetical protein